MNINKLCQHIILNSLTEDHDGNTLISMQNKIAFLKSRIESEYGWLIERAGLARSASEWARGLALDVPFYNGHILEILARYELTTKNGINDIERYWTALGMAIKALITGSYRVKSETEINIKWSIDNE